MKETKEYYMDYRGYSVESLQKIKTVLDQENGFENELTNEQKAVNLLIDTKTKGHDYSYMYPKDAPKINHKGYVRRDRVRKVEGKGEEE